MWPIPAPMATSAPARAAGWSQPATGASIPPTALLVSARPRAWPGSTIAPSSTYHATSVTVSSLTFSRGTRIGVGSPAIAELPSGLDDVTGAWQERLLQRPARRDRVLRRRQPAHPAQGARGP